MEFTPKQERNGATGGTSDVQSGAPSVDATSEVSSVMAAATALGNTYSDFKSGIVVESATTVGVQTVAGVVDPKGL